MDKLSTEVIFVIGVAAMVISQGIKAVAGRFNLKVDRFWISLVLLVVSLILGLVYFPVTWPVFPAASDPGQQLLLFLGWLSSIIPIALSIVGFAMLIYNLLGQKVFGALGNLMQTPGGFVPVLESSTTDTITPIPDSIQNTPDPAIATPELASPAPDPIPPIGAYRNSEGVMVSPSSADSSSAPRE